MPAKWQPVRIFISSTFRDMHAERDHLVKVILTALRERLEMGIVSKWGQAPAQVLQITKFFNGSGQSQSPFFTSCGLLLGSASAIDVGFFLQRAGRHFSL